MSHVFCLLTANTDCSMFAVFSKQALIVPRIPIIVNHGIPVTVSHGIPVTVNRGISVTVNHDIPITVNHGIPITVAHSFVWLEIRASRHY